MIYVSVSLCTVTTYMEISKPNVCGVPQVDLSNDREAVTNLPDEVSLSFNQIAVERVIIKVFTHYRCDVIINDRIRSFFTVEWVKNFNPVVEG